jgi:hypothetical protein
MSRFMYFVDTPISDELLDAAESHRFNTAATQVLLCCDEAQPGLTGVMTEDEALAYVRENEETWRMAGVPQAPPPDE